MDHSELQFLLVEGKNDLHVISALCNKISVEKNFTIIDCEGVDKLFESIPVWFKKSGLKTIGIIIDADTNISSRWILLKEIIKNLDFIVNDSIPEGGLLLTNNKGIKLGIWIMPNNKTTGMLEDFISFLVPEGDRLKSIVYETLDKVEKQGLNKYKPIHRSKAFIHNWLSYQETPGTPLGLAITKEYLTTNSETCTKLGEWLKNLFT